MCNDPAGRIRGMKLVPEFTGWWPDIGKKLPMDRCILSKSSSKINRDDSQELTPEIDMRTKKCCIYNTQKEDIVVE